MHRSQQTKTKFLNVEKTHSATDIEMLRRRNHITGQLYGVGLARPETEQREQTIVGFFATMCSTEKVGTLSQFLQKVQWR